MKKPIFTLVYALLLSFGLSTEVMAQPGTSTTIFSFDSISIVPANPTPTQQVSITVFGHKLDSCVYLASDNVSIGFNTVNLFFGFQVDPPPVHVQCGPASIPWDTTFIVGPLAPAVYTVQLSGSLISSTIPPQDLVFQVAPIDCFDGNGNIWVTNTQDEGVGSLRNAIECANITPGPNLIRFHIPNTSDQKIRVGFTTDQALPALTDPGTTIDGSTQPGFGDNGDFSPKIILDGQFHNWTAPINALFIQGNNCRIFALEIINFPDDAIDVLGADNVVIGLPTAGNIIYNNGSATDFFPDAPPGSGPWEGCGIVVRGGAQGCQINGNIIGTNENLDSGLGNEWCAINVRGGSNSCNIGGPSIGQGNILVGNLTGVRVNASDNCTIQQNIFFCNDAHGIELVNGGNNDLESPQVLTALTSTVSGTTTASNGTIEVYINDVSDCAGTPCQGRYLIGTTTATNGNWSISPPFLSGITLLGGERITATVTDGSRTSAFANCRIVTGVSACTNLDGSIEVTNTADEGPGSLREAIECANSTLGANYIRFSIPGAGPHVIAVGSTSGEALPSLTDAATTIDASSGPQIILDGQNNDWTAPINALFVRADFCEVYALQIINFPDDGIDLTAASYCKIGAIGKGNIIYDNGAAQDFFPDAPGTGPWNGCGIVLKSNSNFNQIIGNAIGTDFGQMLDAGNEYCGIIVQSGSDFNEIGGTETGASNIIANQEQAVRLQSGTNNNSVRQNVIFCNTVAGIELVGNANGSIDAPSITEARVDTIFGLAPGIDGVVEVFIHNDEACVGVPCQGKTYLGMANISSGIWMLISPFDNGLLLAGGEPVTAVTIEDNGNTSEFAACIPVEIPCNILANVIAQQDATCGLANGSTTIGATGGLEPYFYDIGNGIVLDPIFSDLATGDYFITVTDLAGCTAIVETTIGDSPVPSISEGINNDATCGEANGSFSAQASGGTAPYTYDIGNGSQSDTLFTDLAAGNYSLTATDDVGCTVSLAVVINDNGLPVASIVQITQPTCGLNNGSVTVAATGGTPPYSYDIGNGPVSDPFFDGLSPNDYAIIVTDANGCSTSIGAVLNNQGVLPVAGFTFVGVDGTVNFTNTSTNGNAYLWNFGDGSTSMEENPTHTFSSDGDYMVCLTVSNGCGADEVCEIINVLVPLADLTISGIIAKENGGTVSLVEVSCTGTSSQTTQADGYFEFGGLPAGGDFTISPYKNTSANNGVSVLDLVLIQRHLLFVDTLDSPYKIIAADVTNNQALSVSDLVIIQRIILLDLDTFPNNTSWRFVPASHVFADPTRPFSSPFPEVLQLNALNMDASNQDFVAIKTGDVSGNANPAQLVDPEPLQLMATDQVLVEGSEITVALKGRGFNGLSAWQSDFYFDPEQLALQSIEEGALTNVAWGDRKLETGLLPILWHDAEAREEGWNIGEEKDLVYLKFKVLNSGGLLSEALELKANDQRNVALDIQEQSRKISLTFDQTTSSNHLGIAEFSVGQNRPNPFHVAGTVIPFSLPAAGQIQVHIYDISGRLLFQKEAAYSAGNHQIDIPASVFPAAGLYFYDLHFEGQKATHRMIVN